MSLLTPFLSSFAFSSAFLFVSSSVRPGKEKVLGFLLQSGGVQSVAAVIAIAGLGQCFKFVTGG